jgi:hypothetical protein
MKSSNIKDDPEALKAIQKLIELGHSPESVSLFMTDLMVKEFRQMNVLKVKDYLEDKDEIISADQLKFIQDEFVLFIGPIAPVVLEEEIKNMGFDQKYFPKSKIPELLKNITSEFEGNQNRKEHFLEKIMKSSYEQ